MADYVLVMSAGKAIPSISSQCEDRVEIVRRKRLKKILTAYMTRLTVVEWNDETCIKRMATGSLIFTNPDL
jgi:hypothetical protein